MGWVILSIASTAISIAAIIIALRAAHWVRLIKRYGSEHAEMNDEIRTFAQRLSAFGAASRPHASTTQEHCGKGTLK